MTVRGDGKRARLAFAVVATLLALAFCAAAFFVVQNGGDRIGGRIAVQKAMWLFYALALWFVVPAGVLLDARAHDALKTAYRILLVLMVGRAFVEGWMLYVTRNWSPWHGIAHDVVCMIALAACLPRIVRTQVRRGRPQTWLCAHLLVTIAAFVPEIYFAHYMLGNFNTTGAGAIYFVPGEARHGGVLGVTTAVVAFLTLYLPVFLWGWLFGPVGSRDTAHS